jgi:hypothetical protein
MEYRVACALGSLFVVAGEVGEPLASGSAVRLRLAAPPIVLRA